MTSESGGEGFLKKVEVGVVTGSALLLISGICAGIVYISVTVPELLRDVSASLKALEKSQQEDREWQKEYALEMVKVKVDIALLKQHRGR